MWRTHGLEHLELLRPEFSGEIQPSPITGKPEKYFPRWKRWLRYGLSFMLTLPVLLLAIGAMLCSLNFNGYIKDKESPVYIASFAYFAEPVSFWAVWVNFYSWLKCLSKLVLFVIYFVCINHNLNLNKILNKEKILTAFYLSIFPLLNLCISSYLSCKW